MITIPTVLILGAGASVPFYYPSGADLHDSICQQIETSPNQAPFFSYMRTAGFAYSDVRMFGRSLRRGGQSVLCCRGGDCAGELDGAPRLSFPRVQAREDRDNPAAGTVAYFSCEPEAYDFYCG